LIQEEERKQPVDALNNQRIIRISYSSVEQLQIEHAYRQTKAYNIFYLLLINTVAEYRRLIDQSITPKKIAPS
jgi:hypothetical protein